MMIFFVIKTSVGMYIMFIASGITIICLVYLGQTGLTDRVFWSSLEVLNTGIAQSYYNDMLHGTSILKVEHTSYFEIKKNIL